MVKLASLVAFTACLFASQSIAASTYSKSSSKNSTAPADFCDSFKLTYPNKANEQWKANHCYKIKYEVKKSRPSDSMLYVSLLDANHQYVSTLVNGEKTSKSGDSVPFNLYLGSQPVSGSYYLSVKFSNGKECPPVTSPIIHVTYDPKTKYPKCR